ncbi:MAG: N-acetyltransferase [Bacteroidetes bacterium]|nr:MAG: N-acetyltransferase [Bacteroidota bacterium]
MSEYYVHPTAVIDPGCEIGAGSRIWHFCHLMAGCQIGRNCVLGQNVMVAGGVVLGNGVKVQNNVSLYTGVICEDEVFVGPSAVFTNVVNPRAAIVRKHEFRPTLLRKGATIGANATVICGHEIGSYALVGAGAVITRPVKPYALVVGNPARQLGWVSEYGHRLHFDGQGQARCPESGQLYLLREGEVVKSSNT